jgi:Predicted transcriptional regulators
MSIGKRLGTLRGAESQSSLAKKLGVAQTTVRNYENDARKPDSDFIKVVCNYFDVTADWLLFGTEAAPKTADIGTREIQHTENTTFSKNKSADIGVFSELSENERDLSRQLVGSLTTNALLNREVIELHKEITEMVKTQAKLQARIQELEAQVQGFVRSETAGGARGVREEANGSKMPFSQKMQKLSRDSSEFSDEDLHKMVPPSDVDQLTTLDMLRPEKRK